MADHTSHLDSYVQNYTVHPRHTHSSQPSTNPVALACALQLLQPKMKKKINKFSPFLGPLAEPNTKIYVFFPFSLKDKNHWRKVCVCQCSRWVYALLIPFLIAVALGLSPSIRLLLCCLGYFSNILFCYSFRVHSSTRLSYSDNF